MNWRRYKYALALAGLLLDGVAYSGIFVPVSFAIFGFVIGHLIDLFLTQKKHLESMNSSLREQSFVDELTGQYNRRHILTELDKELERARRYKHTLAGIMIDIDDFKKFNDKGGHLLGDYILKEVTLVFDHCVRTIDVLGRYGGDEFMIILPEATPETGTIVAERIKKALHDHPFVFKKKPFKVTCSLGVHFFSDLANVDKADFIDKIDQALYKAKTAGKDRVVAK